jgi:hypothetical protein
MEDHMSGVHVEKIGDMAVIRCEGRMIGSDAAFRLRDEVGRQEDLTLLYWTWQKLSFMGGDVVGMLVFLQVWTRSLGIQFKLFDPPPGVRRSVQRLRSTIEIEIASMNDLLSKLHWEEPRNRIVEITSKAPELKAA